MAEDDIPTPDEISVVAPYEASLDYSLEDYVRAQELVDSPEFHENTTTEPAVTEIHKTITRSVDWESLKNSAAEFGEEHQASESTAFAPGSYRDHMEVGSREEGHYYLEPRYVKEAMKVFGLKIDEMITQCSDDPEDVTPYILASWAFLNFVTIHPYIEGNGRTAEILMDYICRKTDRPPLRINHDWNRIKIAKNNCTYDPVLYYSSLPGKDFVNYLKDSTFESILDPNEIKPRLALEFTLGLLEPSSTKTPAA